MTIAKAAARKLSQELKARNEQGESWQAIAESYGNPIIKRGTLNRIALSGGEYLPKDREILAALELIKPRAQEPQPEWLQRRKKAIRKMARETKKAVLRSKKE